MQGNAIFEHSLGSSNPLAIYRIYCFPGLPDVLALQGAVVFFGAWGSMEHAQCLVWKGRTTYLFCCDFFAMDPELDSSKF